jgi:hypothetical protein
MAADAAHKAHLYKNPQCGCCEQYADYLRRNGFEVTVEATHDLSLINRDHGVPEHLEGCHTTLLDGYVIEGHVPVAMINRLLGERPAITGISLPGMPMGSPGMAGEKTEPLVIYEITKDGGERVFATE